MGPIYLFWKIKIDLWEHRNYISTCKQWCSSEWEIETQSDVLEDVFYWKGNYSKVIPHMKIDKDNDYFKYDYILEECDYV